ncbi:UvrD-helicase domain-containing protein [uncultured Jatrophihabitans sp.]|uniref:UvrD-helicase domain-containing protein n=1 Tax=uncultured Jatrophihabitans sp. TaxID=1610747 RepID=UPI0035CB9528
MSDAEFDLVGDLPTGTVILEASAGTGKTFTIAGLVARYLAEGVASLDELLVVTFGRAATKELRDRVRQRLVSTRDGLVDPAAARESDDALLRHLAAEDVELRRHRIAQALAAFDSATVATTHEFCSRVLAGLGTAADLDTTATFVDNFDDLTDEVVQDLYVRMWARPSAAPPPLTYDEAVELARTVVRDGQAILIPDDAAEGSPADMRHRFATAVRREVEQRKRARFLVSYDDLLTRLQGTLADTTSGDAAAERLRARYSVVLVDEFQDTDPVQWDILRLAFHGHATLVLIGDPKQAIYAFRGADVRAYLAASDVADGHATLAHNWRSDPELLRGLQALFRGASLGDPRIRIHEVSAGYAGRSLATSGAPVQLRVAPGPPSQSVGDARQIVLADVVSRVASLLGERPAFTPRDGSGPRPLEPGDIAVIVHTNAQLELVHDALRAAGVPSVRRTTSSVFRTAVGSDWVVLLEALEQPHRSARLRRLALTPFVGWDAADLETLDLDALGLRVRTWLQVLGERGVAAMLETVSRDERLAQRLLAQVGGERLLTDIRHIGEELHANATAGSLGLAALLEWLRRRVRESHRDTAVERSRRLDSDAAAVQIATVWMSKGLEFPVVLVPFEWDRHMRDEAIPLFHDDDGRRVRDTAGRGSTLRSSQRRHRAEDLGEHLRLLYVALTRAQAQVIAWWAPSQRNTECAPLHRLLFADDPAAEIPERSNVPDGATAVATLQARAQPGALSISAVDATSAAQWSSAPSSTEALSVAQLDRSVDATWRRTSYSALTRGAHDASPVIGSEPETGEKDDEPDTLPPDVDTTDEELRAIPSPMTDLPGGTSFGTLVHAVLENLDDDLDAVVRTQLARYGPADLSTDALVVGLTPALHTPLGPLAGGRSLLDIARGDQLTELDFELPLRGGERPNGVSTLREIADLLRTHLPVGDPLAGYADLLDDPVVGDATLRGYLGGSIDAVLRVDDRFLIVDYKTNRLGAFDEPLTAWHYRFGAMAEAMMHAHYPLQALLYDVALHRFLRWRLADYDPERHLGGVLYLFLRGMCGPSVLASDGTVPGVFAWRPPAALVVALSDALARGVAA